MGRYVFVCLSKFHNPRGSNMSHRTICPSFVIHPQDIFPCLTIFRNVTVMTNPDSSTLRTINNHIPLQNMTTSEDCCSSVSSSLAPVCTSSGVGCRAWGGVIPHINTMIDDWTPRNNTPTFSGSSILRATRKHIASGFLHARSKHITHIWDI